MLPRIHSSAGTNYLTLSYHRISISISVAFIYICIPSPCIPPSPYLKSHHLIHPHGGRPRDRVRRTREAAAKGKKKKIGFRCSTFVHCNSCHYYSTILSPIVQRPRFSAPSVQSSPVPSWNVCLFVCSIHTHTHEYALLPSLKRKPIMPLKQGGETTRTAWRGEEEKGRRKERIFGG